MLGLSKTPFHVMLLRRANVWYTACDGNLSDPNIWISNAFDKKNVQFPKTTDTVYINHNINIDIAAFHVNNLYVSGKISGSNLLAFTITVDGDCQVSGSGTMDLSLQSNNLVLNGYNNIIPYANFIGGGFSTVTYNASNYQSILNLPYHNLTTQNGFKYQTCDITVANTFNQQSNYDCGIYNLTVNGTSSIGTVGACTFYKTGGGSLLFVGAADFEGNVDMSAGNPNIEFRGGLTIHTFNFTPGSGTVTFTTNNQTISCSAYLGGVWNASIVVNGAITVTLSGSSKFQVNNTINGTIGGSTFNNDGVLYLGNNSTPMTTGVFNYQDSSTSTLGYAFNGAITLPYSTYANLVILGTGIKKLGANTVINKTFANNGVFDTNGFNLTVTGTFTNGDGSSHGDFTANAFSSILFVGAVEMQTAGTIGFDVTTGNPNIEFRGGWDVHSGSPTKTGTGTYSFTTNNQAVSFSAYNAGTCAANFLISGAITVTFTSGAAIPNCTGALNGDNASSIFDNRGTFAYSNVTAPMAIGKLFCNQATNTFNYNLAGNQDITVPSDATPGYKNLTLSGSGAKKLLGSVSVKGVYTLTSPATLNSNGFALTNP